MPASHFVDEETLYVSPAQLERRNSEPVVSPIAPAPGPSPPVQVDVLAPGIAPNNCIYPTLPRIPGANISDEEAARIDQLSQDAVRRRIEQDHLEQQQQLLLADGSQNAWPQNLPVRQIDFRNEVHHHQPSPFSNTEVDTSTFTSPDTVGWDSQNGEAAPSAGAPFAAAPAPFGGASSRFCGVDMANPAIDFANFDPSAPLFGGPVDFPDFDPSAFPLGGPVDFPDFDPSTFPLGGPAMTAPVLDLPPFDPSSFPLGGPDMATQAPALAEHYALPPPYLGPAMTLHARPQPTFPPPPAPLGAPIAAPSPTTTTPQTLPPRPKKQRKSRMPAPRPGRDIFQIDTPDTLREGRFAGDSSRNHAYQAGPGWSRDRFRTGPKEQAAAAAAAAGRSPGNSRVKKSKPQGRRG